MKKIILLTLIALSIFSCKEEGEESKLSNSNSNVEDTISNQVKQKSLVSKIYQSCGKIDLANKTIEVKTFLPPLKGDEGTYEYIKYYNISNDKYYGVLGVLEIVDGRNIDLNSHPNSVNSTYTRVDRNTIDLSKLKNFNNTGLEFDALTESDNLTFICFHDDTFTNDNTNDRILKFYQERLPNIEVYKDSSNTKSFPEPMIGNGGILTVNGCE